MKKNLENVYFDRNKKSNKGVALFEIERGELFSKWIGKGKKIIDLGCRFCNITKFFSDGNDVLGFDIDSEALKLCPDNIKTEQVDLNGDWHLNKKDSFDIVVSTEVVEHLYYPEEVFKKINYILKLDGYFVGSVPNAFNLKNRFRLFFARKEDTPLGEPTHINQFSYQELDSLLKRYFKEVEIVPLVQNKWKWFAKIFPGLGSFLLVFRAKK